MHDAGGGADLGVVVGVDVVHQEIDQTALFLEHREEADDFGIGAGGGGRRWAQKRQGMERQSGVGAGVLPPAPILINDYGSIVRRS